jgi:hypothetical protein
MTAAATRAETSGKQKRSAFSKASKATHAAPSEDIAEHHESIESTAPQTESVAEHGASVAEPAPSVVTQPEGAALPVETDATSAGTSRPPEEEGAASPKTDPGVRDPRDHEPRFRIFIVDSGWNHPASKVLHENFDLIHALTHEDPIYVLSHDQSVHLLRKKKSLIGHDPIISVHDLYATGKRGPKDVHGFRLHLGLLDSETEVLTALKSFARFIGTHRNAPDLDASVRRKLNKQGIAGAFEIVGGAATALLTEG